MGKENIERSKIEDIVSNKLSEIAPELEAELSQIVDQVIEQIRLCKKMNQEADIGLLTRTSLQKRQKEIQMDNVYRIYLGLMSEQGYKPVAKAKFDTPTLEGGKNQIGIRKTPYQSMLFIQSKGITLGSKVWYGSGEIYEVVGISNQGKITLKNTQSFKPNITITNDLQVIKPS